VHKASQVSCEGCTASSAKCSFATGIGCKFNSSKPMQTYSVCCLNSLSKRGVLHSREKLTHLHILWPKKKSQDRTISSTIFIDANPKPYQSLIVNIEKSFHKNWRRLKTSVKTWLWSLHAVTTRKCMLLSFGAKEMSHEWATKSKRVMPSVCFAQGLGSSHNFGKRKNGKRRKQLRNNWSWKMKGYQGLW